MIDHLKILGHVYEVIADENLEEHQGAGGLAAIGQNKISYMPTYAPSQCRDVILHESLEIINSCLELNLNHQVIQSLACAMQQLFIDNPQLLAMFKKTRNKRSALMDNSQQNDQSKKV